jgi:hypothetical protein
MKETDLIIDHSIAKFEKLSEYFHSQTAGMRHRGVLAVSLRCAGRPLSWLVEIHDHLFEHGRRNTNFTGVGGYRAAVPACLLNCALIGAPPRKKYRAYSVVQQGAHS